MKLIYLFVYLFAFSAYTNPPVVEIYGKTLISDNYQIVTYGYVNDDGSFTKSHTEIISPDDLKRWSQQALDEADKVLKINHSNECYYPIISTIKRIGNVIHDFQLTNKQVALVVKSLGENTPFSLDDVREICTNPKLLKEMGVITGLRELSIQARSCSSPEDCMWLENYLKNICK